MSYVLAQFDCGHQYDVSLSEVAILRGFCYSPECRTNRDILFIVQKEWMAHCYDCNYKRYFGSNGQEAQAASTRHWRRHNDHRPGAKRGTRPDAAKAQEMVTKRTGVAR